MNRTALHLSVTSNNIDILKLLLDIVTDRYIKDNDGNNILHLACGCYRFHIIEYLSIDYNIHIPNKNNMKAFQMKTFNDTYLIHEVIEFNNLHILKLLIYKVDDIYIKGNNGYNIFHSACRKGQIDIINYLLSIDYNANVMNDNNQHSLHVLVIYNRLDILKLLIDKVDNRYVIDIDGNNILHLACKHGFNSIVEYLLSINYDVNKANNNNQNPLHVSVISN